MSDAKIETIDGVEGLWEPVTYDLIWLHPEWNKGYWRTTDNLYKDGLSVNANEAKWEHFVPNPTAPDIPGIYADKDGDFWYLPRYGGWQVAPSGGKFISAEAEYIDPKGYLPFTLVTKIEC